MNIIPQEGQEIVVIACFVCGFILGLCGGLQIALRLLRGLTKRLDEATRPQTINNTETK